MLDRDAAQRQQQLLEQVPAAEIVDDQFVLDQRPVGQFAAGLAPSGPALRKKTAGDRAIADDRYVAAAA